MVFQLNALSKNKEGDYGHRRCAPGMHSRRLENEVLHRLPGPGLHADHPFGFPPFAALGSQRVCGTPGEQASGGFHRLAPEEKHRGEPVENTVVKPKREG